MRGGETLKKSGMSEQVKKCERVVGEDEDRRYGETRYGRVEEQATEMGGGDHDRVMVRSRSAGRDKLRASLHLTEESMVYYKTQNIMFLHLYVMCWICTWYLFVAYLLVTIVHSSVFKV